MKDSRPKSPVRRYWSKFWRISLGSILVLAGLVMCITPGPGIVTIIAGLAVMADEVPFARRTMDKLIARARKAEKIVMGKTKKKPENEEV